MLDENEIDIPIKLTNNENDDLYYYPSSGKLSFSTIASKNPLINYSNFNFKSSMTICGLAIALTMECNLNCSYCYNQYNDKANTLDSTILFKAIDELLLQTQNIKYLGLIFSGGEPLIEYNIFKDTVIYASEQSNRFNIPLKVTLYTNGTLLNEDIIDFLFKYNVHTIISLDGKKKLHDFNRNFLDGSGTYSIIVNNIKKMIDKGMENSIEARAVIKYPHTNLVDILESHFMQGIKRIHLIPAYSSKQKLITNIDNWLEVLKIYESLLINGIIIEVSPFYSIFRKLYSPLKFINSFYPCSAGWNSIGIGSDGFYYLCHHFSNSSAKLNKIGQGIPNLDDYLYLIKSVDQIEPCKKCWAKRLCGGCCYHRKFIGGGPDTINDCEEWRQIIRETILTYHRLLMKVPDTMRIIGEGNVYVPVIYSDSGVITDKMGE